jgi:5-methylcytosine-specific restriction endonuclease McrA
VPSRNRPELRTYKWQKRAALIRRRDRVCRHCGSTQRLSVHHIIRPCNGGTDHPDNLVLLCGKCHAAQHGSTPTVTTRPRFSRNTLKEEADY